MENNGKANAMETLKAKVLELKEKWNPPVWTLAGFALFLAVPISGGTLALGSFLTGAHPLAVVWVLGGLVGYTYLIYTMSLKFLMTLDQAIAGADEEEEN